MNETQMSRDNVFSFWCLFHDDAFYLTLYVSCLRLLHFHNKNRFVDIHLNSFRSRREKFALTEFGFGFEFSLIT